MKRIIILIFTCIIMFFTACDKESLKQKEERQKENKEREKNKRFVTLYEQGVGEGYVPIIWIIRDKKQNKKYLIISVMGSGTQVIELKNE